VTFNNMKTKLKKLKESTCKIFWMKIILKVFKNRPRRATYQQMGHALECQIERVKRKFEVFVWFVII
jgi:hypothetical protein